ncbi:wax ester/triacylglycerol synthase family O-acyltransferase [Nocardioides sp. GY 10113]|uniref:WS/DGAT/MGAT family O-acyltransferase n=1 Tax=Nocardioides sp. GY 10113 TaxID=2569761 RepID=UPI0010A90906|nr:wax ester/triacylglycerol synthase family O-acyltransferase [Nocardioides sp. GY 10113]TIC88856.1 wax ester/triacylglycerol synthase family O-acyltransferase [Nocardioides sp. GY 10113]
MRQLSAFDSQFLQIESATTLGHVGTLITLDTREAPAWGLGVVRSLLAERVHLAPVFRQRLVQVPFRLTRPYWVPDPDFDLAHHVREVGLPAGGTEVQLGELVAFLHSLPLDRSRPLWEAWVITGLADGAAAIYTKVHHSAIDGLSGAEVLAAVLDLTREPRAVEPEPTGLMALPLPTPTTVVRQAARTLVRAPRAVVGATSTLVRHLDQVPGAARIPTARVVSQAADLTMRAFGAPARPRAPRLLRAPDTPLNRPISSRRCFAYGSIALGDVRRVRRHAGGTTNDAVMALCTTALRRWLLDHDGLPDTPLVAAVPVSTRVRGRKGEGNEIATMLAALPTHIADPLERLRATRDEMARAKDDFDASPIGLLHDLAVLVPPVLNGAAVNALMRLAAIPGVPFNVMVSNVPGPPRELFVAGARVQGMYPASVITDLTGALNITLFSYRGSLDFGLIADPALVPDVWNLVRYLQEAVAELIDAIDADDDRPGSSRVPDTAP